MVYNHISIRKTKLKKKLKKFRPGCKSPEIHTLQVETQSWEAPLGSSLATSYRDKTYLLHDPAIPLLAIYSKEIKRVFIKILEQIFIGALFTVDSLGTTEMSTNRRVNKQIVVYPYDGTLAPQ